MKGTIQDGTRFVVEATEHLVRAHGRHRGAYATSNFPGYVDSHTIQNALRDSLIGYAIPERLVVGANGRVCDTCRRILWQGGRPVFETRDYFGKPMTTLRHWDGFAGPCCDRDPENSGRPFSKEGAR